MRILMLGWEYPPHISGGLATACHGLVESLLMEGHEVQFLLPKAVDEIQTKQFRLISAGKIELPKKKDSVTFSLLRKIMPHVNPTLLHNLGGDTYKFCLLYTSDAADDLLCVDIGGRRI